jgi:hypothetical protein
MTEGFVRQKGTTTALGSLVARVLTGGWRHSLAPVQIEAGELEQVTPLLLTSGDAAIVWRRIRKSGLYDSKVALALRQALRNNALHNLFHIDVLKRTVSHLRTVGIEAVLVKGWSIARYYPEEGLRPYGDLDLCVRPEDYQKASRALEDVPHQWGLVDLHNGFGKFYERNSDEVWLRTQLIMLAGVEVRVLCPEDHLRFLCLHLLRHGATRPLWACDVAVALEGRASDFAWDICLGTSRRESEWIACALGIAHRLLGAEIAGTPVEQLASKVPRWVLSTVLKEWSLPFEIPPPMMTFLDRPAALVRELARHWPNSIEATINLGGSYNNAFPRWPYRLGDVSVKAVRLLVQARNTRQRARSSLSIANTSSF